MNNKKALVVGGTGQIGLYLSKFLLTKKYLVFITTRGLKQETIKKINFLKIKKKISFINLRFFNYNEIKKLLIKVKPDEIYYLAGQSSVEKSFQKEYETIKTNFINCENFLKVIKDNSLNTKFFNAASSEIYGNHRNKVNLHSKKKPVSPYGKAKLQSFNLVKRYRDQFNLNAYNGIIFNTDSFLRPKKFLIPKICLSAIKSKKNKKVKIFFGDIDIIRDWSWCEEQVIFIWKHLQTKPKDFLVASGKSYKARELLEFAYGYFKLNYKDHVKFSKQFKRRKDIRSVKININPQEKKFKIYRNAKIYGKKMIIKLIEYYLNNGKQWK